MSSSPGPSQHSLQEIIVTLPRWAVGGLLAVLAAAMVLAGWVALNGASDKQRELATTLLLVLVPTFVAVGVALGVQRSGTEQVDALVTDYLEHTVQQRLRLACEQRTLHAFPFERVRLVAPALNRSFVLFRLDWATDAKGQRPHDSVEVQVKMNVVNVEIMTNPRLQWTDAALPPNLLLEPGEHTLVLGHPVAQRLAGALQGALEEGYAVRLLFDRDRQGAPRLRLSVRQKLQQHFLASPYLKRYHAEDAAIFIGWLFTELSEAGLLPTAAAPA
jgi:hypothetical protein